MHTEGPEPFKLVKFADEILAMPTPASRPPFYTTLLAFVLAQVIVAIIVRWLLWPMAGKMWVLRSFARQDLIVIAGFAAVVLAMALALGRTRRGRVPVTVLAIMRAVLPMRLAGSPWPLPGLAASCALVAATAHPAKADYWRDGVSNPAQALWSGMWQSGPDELLRAKGDGRTSAYAPPPRDRGCSGIGIVAHDLRAGVCRSIFGWNGKGAFTPEA